MRIDQKKVVAMARTGFQIKQIAKRLRCSEKQVSRILKQHGVKPTGEAAIFFENDLEELYISAIQKIENNYQATADRLGMSRQAVWEKLNREAL